MASLVEYENVWTSTTAPGKHFSNRSEMSLHYKSDWHRYNLKRKEAGLTPVTEEDFKARLEAAVALRRERANKKEQNSKSHLKHKNLSNKNNNSVSLSGSNKSDAGNINDSNSARMETNETEGNGDNPEDSKNDDDEDIVIDPLQSLFDNHKCKTVQANIEYMQLKYGFFVPDVEYLTDPEGLIGYCAEKIFMGHICLYCQKTFRSGQATQRHMIAKQHCKLRYEENIDLEEFEVFYDFEKANKDYLDEQQQYQNKTHTNTSAKKDISDADMDDDSDDEWEDVEDDEETDDMYDGYTDALVTNGFGVTELGELILPSGKVIGHRTLSKYYNQKFAPERTTENAQTAVSAVLQDRYYNPTNYDDDSVAVVNSNLPSGRVMQNVINRSNVNCKGILVGSSGGGFSAVSLYRYRAAVKKSRLGEAQGHRAYMKYKNNGNKFDKKGNRLVTNVSVAHALR